jgi:NAD(P)-dependent dehydrogenase (short-subunit alcohol dehydrogenase family)
VTKCEQTVEKLQEKLPTKSTQISTLKLPLDLANLDSVHDYAEYILNEFPRLDYLVHAAGELSFSSNKTKQGFEAAFGREYLGPFALTQWLLPLLLKPVSNSFQGVNAARILSIVSTAAFDGQFHSSLLTTPNGQGDFIGEWTDNCGDSNFLFLSSTSASFILEFN